MNINEFIDRALEIYDRDPMWNNYPLRLWNIVIRHRIHDGVVNTWEELEKSLEGKI